MRITRIISSAATAVALTAGIGLAAPLVASAGNHQEIDACHLDKKVDEIQGWDVHHQWNIMVWRDRAWADGQFHGIEVQGTARAKPCREPAASETTFHWVAFRDGYFVRKGDGGYVNWAFSGKFTRDGGERVNFQARF